MIPSSEISFQDFDSVCNDFQHVIKETVETETNDFHDYPKQMALQVVLDLWGPNDWVSEGGTAGESHYF